MSRVVHALDSGELSLDIPPLGTIQLPFIVFEWAEHGDVHSLLTVSRDLDVAWKMQVLHQVATGVKQLHAAEIAHQDIKRSNVVFIEPSDGKIIDLGRAVKKDRTSRNDLRDIPCQIPNAAPELLYGYAMSDWAQRHFATDLYMLGNLAFTLLFDVTITERLITKLPPTLRPFTFGGTYADVLPALQHALASLLAEIEPLVPEPIRKDYLAALRMLCEPDPALRGHPTERQHAHANRYSMQRFISLFDSMRRKAATKF